MNAPENSNASFLLFFGFMLCHQSRTIGCPTSPSLIPERGIPVPGSSGERAHRRIGVIIGVMTVAVMIPDSRNTVNALGLAEELGTGIRTV
jgi:hypothetical protein